MADNTPRPELGRRTQWQLDSPRLRYSTDAQYKSLVDMLEAMIHQCHYSPSEVREAAILACINYEMHTIRSYCIPVTPEMSQRLDELYYWVDGGKLP